MFHNDTFTSQLDIILKMKLMESRHILLLIFAKNEKITCSGAKIQPLEIDHQILTENLYGTKPLRSHRFRINNTRI